MLMREDGKKIPIGLIPNGSGNDTCFNLEICNYDEAIEAIINGCDLIKSDVCLNMLDYETDQSLKQKFNDDIT